MVFSFFKAAKACRLNVMSKSKVKAKINRDNQKQKQRRITVISAVMFLFFLFIPVCEGGVNIKGSVFYDNVCISSFSGTHTVSVSTSLKKSGKIDVSDIEKSDAVKVYSVQENFYTVDYENPINTKPKTDLIIPVGKQAPPVF